MKKNMVERKNSRTFVRFGAAVLCSATFLFGAALSACGTAEDEASGNEEQSTQAEAGDAAANQQDSTQTGQTDPTDTQTVSYTSHGFTIELPENWEEQELILETDNGFEVYQKASYEKQKGMGFLFGFQKSTDYMNYGAGENLIGYTDDGDMYYSLQPTDVTCDLEDETIYKEYQELMAQADEILDSVQIEGEVHRDVDEYVIPVSAVIPLNEDVLGAYDKNELWMAKNEIYARHGRKFQNEYLQGYFDSQSWYTGTVEPADFNENVLSEIESDNVKAIAAREDALDAENPYPMECETEKTVQADLTGDGTLNSIFYHVKETGDDEYSYQLTIDGVTHELGESISMDTPVTDVFYITDIDTTSPGLEIAVLDMGPSNDPVSYFFRYDGEGLSYIGSVGGFPFPEQHLGKDGFDGYGNITGLGRVDLIETAYVEAYWWYDEEAGELTMQERGWYPYDTYQPHELYEDLPVHRYMDLDSESLVIPAQKEVYFTVTDGSEWIQVKGKDGSVGFMQVKDGNVVELGKTASDVFSDLYYFD